MPRFWIVVCPENKIRSGSLWARWYRENCGAVGWPPPKLTLDGPLDKPRPAWDFCRKRLKQIQIGDKVIPFPQKWRIGPVGTVTAIKVADTEWNPTLQAEDS